MSAEMTAAQKQHHKMTQTPIPRLIISLAIPTMISMMITSIYSMADTFFVSKLGTSAAGAVGIVMPLMAIIQAAGFMLGMGGGNIVSRMLGAKKQSEADEVASTALFSAVIFGILLLAVGLPFVAPMMSLLGATPTILPYAVSYGQYILYAAPLLCGSFVLNNLLRGEGKASLAMVGIAAGGVLNIALDPLFIFTFNLGIAGAAIATAISQMISFCILLFMFLSGKSAVHLSIRKMSRHLRVYVNIIKTGMPSFARQGLASVSAVALNWQAHIYGDAALAAISIVSRIFMLLFSVMLGFGQGFQPVAGFNFGAKKYRRVYNATLFTMLVGTGLMTVVAIVGFIFAPHIMRAFRADDAEVIALGSLAARAQCLLLPATGIVTGINMGLQVTGQSVRATFLSMCRQGVFFFPLVFLLPMLLGVNGVLLAQPAADVFTLLVSIPFAVSFLKMLKSKEHEGLEHRQNEA